MTDAKPQRRFQFSLRKLMLWTAVLVPLYSVRRLQVPASIAVAAGLYLGTIVIVRLALSVEAGLHVAFCGSGLFFAAWFAWNGIYSGGGDINTDAVIGLCLGCASAAVAMLAASLAVWVVNTIDALLQTKVPASADRHHGRPTQEPPPVDGAEARPPFQFSLRRLMLWMAVLGAYLTVLRWIPGGPFRASVLTAWLVGIWTVRAWRPGEPGYTPAARCSVVSTMLALACVTGQPVWSAFTRTLDATLLLCWLLVACGLGMILGVVILSVADLVCSGIDWLDGLMQTKTPQTGAEDEKL